MAQLNYKDFETKLKKWELFSLNTTLSKFSNDINKSFWGEKRCILLVPPDVSINHSFPKIIGDNGNAIFLSKLEIGKSYCFITGKRTFAAKVMGTFETQKNIYAWLKLESGIEVFWLIDSDGRCTGLGLRNDLNLDFELKKDFELSDLPEKEKAFLFKLVKSGRQGIDLSEEKYEIVFQLNNQKILISIYPVKNMKTENSYMKIAATDVALRLFGLKPLPFEKIE
jgi:hypothetical protein